MKRGLAVLRPDETPLEAFAARLNTLRDKLREADAAVALIYGDVSRSGDIAYLTNLCLYWNEAILAVPVEGKPALITKLSKRVQPWMKETTILDDIRSGPRMTENVGRFLEERFGTRDKKKICLVDLQLWPDALIDQLQNALPKRHLCDMAGAVRGQRLIPSDEELRLLQRANELLNESIERARAEGADASERAAITVRNVRRAGFQDASVSWKVLSDGSECVDAIGQFRYVWVRLASPRRGPMAECANDALQAAKRGMKPGVTEEALSGVVTGGVNGKYRCRFSCIPHLDIETKGIFRAVGDGKRPLREGEVVSVAVTLSDGKEVVSASEVLRMTRDGAEALRTRVS